MKPATKTARGRLAAALLAVLACFGCAGPGSFSNPVLDLNFPDPFVLRTSGGFIAYATNGNGERIQSAFSRDLVHWQRGGDAMPTRPSWAEDGFTWAPEVIRIASHYLLFYTARLTATGVQCIGVARAEDPRGPFSDRSQQPLVCQRGEGGSIDPSPFASADGKLYLYWKNDGNARRMPTWIYGQSLASDGLSLTGEAQRLLRNDARWEGDLIEAPTVLAERDRYYLLYSANDYGTARYAVGYASAPTPLGPFEKSADNPILSTAGDSAGPGHQTVVTDDAGQRWIVFHAWHADAIGERTGRRVMRIEPLRFDANGAIERIVPRDSQQPAPTIRPHASPPTTPTAH